MISLKNLLKLIKLLRFINHFFTIKFSLAAYVSMKFFSTYLLYYKGLENTKCDPLTKEVDGVILSSKLYSHSIKKSYFSFSL